MKTPNPNNDAAGVGCDDLVVPLWRKDGKAWTDLYHPLTVQLRDHSKHSRKQKRHYDNRPIQKSRMDTRPKLRLRRDNLQNRKRGLR